MSSKRNLGAGALMALVGAGAVAEGLRLRIGTLTHMGPGFFPTALGVLLVLLGLMIASSGPDDARAEDVLHLEPRGGLCVLAGVLAFIFLGMAFGFIAATFAAVFVSALGDRTARLREAALLAAGVATVGAIVFVEMLGIPFPLVRWF